MPILVLFDTKTYRSVMSYSNLDIFMKGFENIDARVTLHPGIPVCIRLDGRNFHNVTKHCERPFDPILRKVMTRVTEELITECSAVIGYTQSDEITLVIPPANTLEEMYFGGRTQKLCSILASVASVAFNKYVKEFGLTAVTATGYFDCRCWNVPNMEFASDVIMWRQRDAIKNSISMAAQSKFSHTQLLNKNSIEKIRMLNDAGIDYYTYRSEDRQGVILRKSLVERKFTEEELAQLPPMHEARKNPDMMVKRNVITEFSGENLSNIVNRREYLFDGTAPIAKIDSQSNPG